MTVLNVFPSVRGAVLCALFSAQVTASGEALVILPLPVAGYEDGVSPTVRNETNGETPSLFAAGDAMAVTRPVSARRRLDADAGLTMQRRRWRNMAAASGAQPYTWGLSGDVSAQMSLGLQTEVLYTDNVGFDTNDIAKGATILEMSPIVRLDIGDPQEGAAGAARLSQYYAGLLYVPTLHYRVDEGNTEYLQHFFSEVGRMTEISRVSFRLDYDERILASSDDTSPEDTYTLLEASSLLEHHFTAKTMLRTKATYRDITVEDGFSNRSTWIGEAAVEWAATAKTTLGLGTEIARIRFDREENGTQDYQQALLMFRWRPTAKLSVASRAGAEWREFDGGQPRDTHISPVAAAALQWQATEQTRVSARFRVGNEPSIIEQGALFQEIRFSTEVVHDFSFHWYASGEFQIIGRDYDTGHRETETGARVAVGFRESPDKMSDHLNLELYFQWRQRNRSDTSQTADRSQIGLQATKFF